LYNLESKKIKLMITLVQLNYNELQSALKDCIKEVMKEFKELPSPAEPPDRISLEEAEVLTGLKKSVIYKLTSTNGIPHARFGKRLIFSRKELLAWIESRTVKPIAPTNVMSAHLAKVANKKIR
jgi:excisionase family DNA binding protein